MRINHFLSQPRFGRYVCFPESLGHYYDDASHRERRERGLSYFNLHLVFRGKGYLETKGGTVPLTEGTGFLFGPGTPQCYYADADEPWDIRWFHLFGPGVEQLLEGRGSGEAWLFSWKGASRIQPLADELLTLADPLLQERETHLSAVLYELLAELAQHGESVSGGAQLPGLRSKMLQAADWIRERCAEPLTLEAMARTHGYSLSYFSRQFHEVMGKPPIDYLTECRITLSKKLLVTSDAAVKDIAEQAGFAQSSYFIRKFRAAEGMTPQQFRLLRQG